MAVQSVPFISSDQIALTLARDLAQSIEPLRLSNMWHVCMRHSPTRSSPTLVKQEPSNLIGSLRMFTRIPARSIADHMRKNNISLIYLFELDTPRPDTGSGPNAIPW